MGSCSSEPPTGKGLDTRVGGLVWVRRGNGSWWPGQIMDLEQVSDACLDVPVPKFNGVPIKLLGRDDVTVEWYNLELTTKVKSFRCGEHDSCIEKAKASQGNPSKKRPKHTLREKAIILALEIETSLMRKKYDMCSGANNFDSEPSGNWSKCTPSKSHTNVVIALNACPSKEKSDSAPELSHSGISFEEARDGSLAKITRQRTPNDSEDDGNRRIKKRMRGLDDLGLGLGRASVNEASASNSLPTKHLANGNRGGCVSFCKKKRSKVLFHDILKRKNRRRMLTKVFQSDTLMSVPIIFDDLPSPRKYSNYEGNLSGFESNDNNNNSNSTGVSWDYDIPKAITLENLFDVPLIYEAEISYGCPLVRPPLTPQYDSPVEVNDQEQVSATTSTTAHLKNATRKTERGPTEWQLKGRRNSRQQNRNPEPLPGYNIPYLDSVLYDVQIEVKASYRPQHQHIPYISLTSKLNGKPVTGHPITIGVLEDGECDLFVDVVAGVDEDGDELMEPRKGLLAKKQSRAKNKKQGSCSKKTRRLSALTRSHGKGAIKYKERMKAPTLACVPLKVVFSRVNEALKGSALTRAAR